MNTADQHAAAMAIVHEEAGRTLSKDDFDLCMRIAKRALLHSDAAQAPIAWIGPMGMQTLQTHGEALVFSKKSEYAENALYVAPGAAAQEEDTYVAQRMAETLAEVYTTIIGDDARQEDESLNAIERVKKAAQVLRLEVDLYRAQRVESAAQGEVVRVPSDYANWRLHANGMYGLLSSIIGAGALRAHGDDDLAERIRLAIAHHERMWAGSAPSTGDMGVES
jgi:hypothetical protein